MTRTHRLCDFMVRLFTAPVLLLTITQVARSQHAYVPNSGAASVSVIDTTSNTVLATIPVGLGPISAAVTPDGTKVYVANVVSSTVSVIASSTNTVVNTIAVGKSPVWVAISQDGSAAYVANAGANNVSVIDTGSDAVVNTIVVGSNPVRVSIGSGRAYVANAGSKSVSVIDTSLKTVVATVPVASLPTSVALPPASTSVGGGGTGGGGTAPQPLKALPETLATINAAVDLLTASGNIATLVVCGSPTTFNCPGGNPSTTPAQIQFLRSAVSVTADSVPLPNTTYSFNASMSAASLTDIPMHVPAVGDCSVSIDTTQGSPPTLTVTGNLNFASHSPGDPINEVDFSALQIGLANDVISINGGFACSLANFSKEVAKQEVFNTLLSRLPGGKLCGVVGPALFQQCPP